MTIKIDVDGVIRDMLGAMCKMYYKFDPTVVEENITDYDVEKSFPLIKMRTGMSAHDYFFVINSEDTLYKVPTVLNGARYGIEKLREAGHKVVIVTNQFGFNNKLYTLNFLNFYGIPYDDICFTEDKWSIEGDYIIDDNPDFLNDEREKAKKIIIDAPYNRKERKYHRFCTLTDAATFILLEAEEKEKKVNYNETKKTDIIVNHEDEWWKYQSDGKVYEPFETYECCRNCINNPKNNPNASGICNCMLPYMQTQRTGYKTVTTNETTTPFIQTEQTITNKIKE